MNATLFPELPRNECVFSPCRRYRYLLKRVVDRKATKGICLWVLANPSVADEVDLDPTLRHCADYAARWGYSEMRVVNVRAWVETKSEKVPPGLLAIGPDNFQHVMDQTLEASLVVCGWGKLGGELGLEMLHAIKRVCVPHALKLTNAGEPYHPLYLRKELKPFPLEAA